MVFEAATEEVTVVDPVCIPEVVWLTDTEDVPLGHLEEPADVELEGLSELLPDIVTHEVEENVSLGEGEKAAEKENDVVLVVIPEAAGKSVREAEFDADIVVKSEAEWEVVAVLQTLFTGVYDPEGVGVFFDGEGLQD